MMRWLMRWRQPPDTAADLEVAREDRDAALDHLDRAIDKVDHETDRMIADYEAAEQNHIGRGNP